MTRLVQHATLSESGPIRACSYTRDNSWSLIVVHQIHVIILPMMSKLCDIHGSTYSGYNAIRIFLKPNKKIKYNTHKIIEKEKKFFSNFCLLDNYT